MTKIEGRKITLIGGAGFIGHNLALYLNSLGAELSIIDSLQVNNIASFSSTSADSVNRNLYLSILNERQSLLQKANIPLFVQDARNYHALSRLIGKIEPEIVIQLAAVSHANKSNKDPFSTFDHSFRTLENALDVCRGKVKHFIYFSSSMVYGHFQNSIVTEETPCKPLGIYGALKYGGEKLVIAYNQVFDLLYEYETVQLNQGAFSRHVQFAGTERSALYVEEYGSRSHNLGALRGDRRNVPRS